MKQMFVAGIVLLAVVAALVFLRPTVNIESKPISELLGIGSFAEYDVNTTTANYTYRWEVTFINGSNATVKESFVIGQNKQEFESTLDMETGNIITGNESACFIVNSHTISRCRSVTELRIVSRGSDEFAGKTRDFIGIEPQFSQSQKSTSFYDAETGILLRSSLDFGGDYRLDVLKSTNIF